MRVILFSGKGGTGKSVISCATGMLTSESGYDTLVMSADPAHSLADAFEMHVGDEPVRLAPHLSAVQIDPSKEMARSYGAIQDYLASIFTSKGIDETLAYEISSLPTMTYLFALLRIEEIARTGQYDVIVLDTVPSGETLRYLYFPRLVGSVSRKIIKLMGPIAGMAKIVEPLVGIPAPNKSVFSSQIELIERMERLSTILKDNDQSGLRLVANPDLFSTENLKRSLMISGLYGINSDLAIINKIIPEDVSEPFFNKWKVAQTERIREVEDAVYPLPVKKVRLFPSELKGVEMLRQCGKEMYGDDDPAKIYYKGVPFKLESRHGEVEITVRVPFSEKEDFKVERIGEELILKVRTKMGYAINVIPLPAITLKMNLKRARLLNDELHVIFREEDGKVQEGRGRP